MSMSFLYYGPTIVHMCSGQCEVYYKEPFFMVGVCNLCARSAAELRMPNDGPESLRTKIQSRVDSAKHFPGVLAWKPVRS